MDFKGTAQLIERLEACFDVDTLRFRDMRIWPLVRLAVDRHQIFEGKGKPIQGPHEPGVHVEFDPAQFRFLRPLRYTEFLLLSGHAQLTSDPHEVYFDRFLDPLVEMVKARHSWLKIEMESPEGLLKLPRKQPTIFIRPPRCFPLERPAGSGRENSVEGFGRFRTVFQGLSGMEIDEKLFVHQARIIEGYQAYFEEMLLELKPRVVFVVCYFTLLAMSLVRACKKLNIRTVDMQHGILGKYHVLYTHWGRTPPGGYDLVPDFFWTWGRREKRYIEETRSGPAVTRSPWSVAISFSAPGSGERGRPLTGPRESSAAILKRFRKVILVTLQWTIPMPRHLLDVMKHSPEDWYWLIRLHPLQKQDKAQTAREIRRQGIGIARFDVEQATEAPLYALLEHCHCHVTCSSSVSYEALAFHVPTVIIHASGRHLFEEDIKESVFSCALTRDSLMQAIVGTGSRQVVENPSEYADTAASSAEKALNSLCPPARDACPATSGDPGDRESSSGEGALDPRGLALGQEGAYLLQAGKPRLALESLERALQLNGKAADLHCARALALKELGHGAEAIAAARAGLSVEPGHRQTLGLLRRLSRLAEGAGADPRSGEKHAAVDLNDRGESLFGRGDLPGALEAFRRALESEPGFAPAHNNLGVTYWRLGETHRALHHLAAALEIDPEDRDTILNCGDLFRALGKTQEARGVYTGFLQRNPGDETVMKALETLEGP